MGIYVFFLLLLAPVTDEATCNALLPLYGEHISYSQARDGAQWTDEQVAAFFLEAPADEDPRRFVGALASWLSPRIRYQSFASCWQQWGNSLDQPGHRAIAELLYTRELSSLQRQGLPDSVITRYFEIQDIWQFSGVSGIEVQYAIALHDGGDYENAIDELEGFLSQPSFTAKHPEYSNVLNAIGNVYYDLDRYDEAEYFYGEAIATSQLSPDMVFGARLNLASVYRKQDRNEEALLILQELLDEAVANGSQINELQIRINIGNALLAVGKSSQARTLYQSVIEQSRHYGVAKGKLYGFLNMVEWHFRMDLFEEAKPWIDSVFTIMPEVASHYESVQAYKQLARFFDETGLTDESAFYAEAMSDLESRTELGLDVEAILADLYRISFNQVRQSVELMNDGRADDAPISPGWVILGALLGLTSIWVWVRRHGTRERITGGVIKETEGFRSSAGPTQQDIVQVVLTAIRESPDYLDPDVLARDLVRSLGYSSRLITEVMHSLGLSSVASLVNRVRVDHAIALVREAPHTVSQDIIYRSVGFTSRRTYNRVFKAVTKVSPGEYLDRLNGSVDGITEFVDEGPRPD